MHYVYGTVVPDPFFCCSDPFPRTRGCCVHSTPFSDQLTLSNLISAAESLLSSSAPHGSIDFLVAARTINNSLQRGHALRFWQRHRTDLNLWPELRTSTSLSVQPFHSPFSFSAVRGKKLFTFWFSLVILPVVWEAFLCYDTNLSGIFVLFSFLAGWEKVSFDEEWMMKIST